MSKHTPGPWIGQDENGKFNSDHDWSVDHETASSSESAPVWAGGKVIAFAVHSSDSFSLRSHPSVTANARLIAAAPELLEALRHCATEEGPEQQWLDRARTLIAKVDGELFNCWMCEGSGEWYSNDDEDGQVEINGETYHKEHLATLVNAKQTPSPVAAPVPEPTPAPAVNETAQELLAQIEHARREVERFHTGVDPASVLRLTEDLRRDYAARTDLVRAAGFQFLHNPTF